ncbi:hypothetical protein KPG66_12545 [Mycetohabitans sp. B2]|uniref:hypothetical protein n=1 Tax=Mycetohabitans sp. B2 TaxID=2841274 RepID=UPI001F37F4E6|nr:hypothetical protein [Mycetohabitans sp. B2]MCF7696889.1 hypothetical protein [Mycetohabitans sp. B2]
MALQQDTPFVLDDRTIARHLRDWHKQCEKIQFETPQDPSATHSWADVLFPDGVESLIQLVEDPTQSDGQLPPHQALLLAFLQLLQTPRALLNALPAQHRQFYYRQVLGLRERAGVADRVVLSFQLNDDRPEKMLPAGLLVDAGQDSDGTPRRYQLDQNLLANQSRWTDLRWCQPTPGGGAGIYRIVYSAQQPWPTAGIRLFEQDDVRDQPIVTGRVLSTPALALSGGTRTLTLKLGGKVDNVTQLQAYASSNGKWIPLPNTTATGQTDPQFTLGVDAPAISASPGLDGFTNTAPLLKLIDPSGQAVPEIKQLSIQVEQLPDARLSTDDGVAKLTERVYPFGMEPLIGSGVYLTAADFYKPKCEIKLTLMPEWLDLPAVSFSKWYENYKDVNNVKDNDAFKLKATVGSTTSSWSEIHPIFSSIETTGEPTSQSLQFTFSSFNATPSTSLDPREWPQYLRLELAGQDFLHKEYWQYLTAPAEEDSKKVLNPPYTPQFKNLSVGYQCDYTLSPEIDKQYVLTPFGYADAEGAVEQCQLYLGFEHLLPGQDLALHWQLSSAQRHTIAWEYLCDSNQWKSLDAQVRDDTNGLFHAGLWSATLPDDASTHAPAMPPGRCWIRSSFAHEAEFSEVASKSEDVSNFPWINGLHTNSVTATRVSGGDLELALPAGTITRTVESCDGVQTIVQPWPSEGGRGPENETEFLARIARRLNHRNRALTWRDIIALLHDRYPEVYDARITQPQKSSNSAEPPIQQLVIIPAPGQRDNTDALRPMFNPARLQAMQQYLLSRASPWLARSLSLRNPTYKKIPLEYELTFNDNLNPYYGYRQVKLALTAHYMPWADDANHRTVTLGESLDYYALLAFIQQLAWVKSVNELKLDGEEKAITAQALEVLILDIPDYSKTR